MLPIGVEVRASEKPAERERERERFQCFMLLAQVNDHTQFTMQDRGLKPPEDVLSCSRTLLDRRLKPPIDHVLKCPRCDSYNTKFCYYNNYSLSQPRHFCKNCRRYWTKGGALRNVPVGGGCRKNKRTKQRSTEQSSTSHQNESAVTSLCGENSSCPALPENLSGQQPSSVFYNFPLDGNDINSTAFARAQQTFGLTDQPSLASSTAAFFGIPVSSQFSSLPQSLLSALNNQLSSFGGMQSLRNGLMGLDFTGTVRPEPGNIGVGDFTAILDTPHQLNVPTPASAPGKECVNTFTLALDTLNGIDPEVQWRLQQHKLALQKEAEQIGGHLLLPLESAQNEKMENSRVPSSRSGLGSLSHCMKGEEESRRTGDWQGGQEGFFEGTAEQNYWNNGQWSDLSGYGPSASPLL